MVTNSAYSCVPCLSPGLSRLLVLPMRTYISGGKKGEGLFLSGFEPETFRVRGERDNHYTTETGHFLQEDSIQEIPRSATAIQSTDS